jgi:hypothetical protein
LQREPWVSRNRLALGLCGEILAVLVAVGTIFVGLIFSDVLRSYNIYATGETNPQQIAIQDFVLGGVGLAAGIIGIIGSKIRKQSGGILLIIAGAMSLLFLIPGVLPAVLMLVSGATEIGKKPPEAHNVPGKFAVFITQLKSFENVAAFSMYFAVLSLITFVGGWSFNEFQDSFGLFYVFYPLIFLFPAISFMKKKNALKSVFSKIFFSSALILIVLSGVFFGFHIITSTGFLVVSLVTVPTFTLLYAWVEKFSKQTESHSYQTKNKHKIVGTIFVLAGIILLVFSLAFASHVEQRLGEVRHHENILSQDFNLTYQIPDTTISANLTTQDSLAYGIYPASYPHQKGYSSIDFTISYQPALEEPIVKVYERNNISSRASDGSGGWSVTLNGTYILNFHYNYNETIHVNENIGRQWSTTELLPTTVYTPLFANYMAPTLIIASALLIGGIAIPIRNVLQKNQLQFDKA